MIDHLPECPQSKGCQCPWMPECDDCGCICDRLRACEQRVREEESRNVIGSVSLAAIGEANLQQYQLGFSEGLDAAREAVAALEPLLDVEKGMGGYDCCGCATVGYLWTDALAAIDALRGES